MAVTRIAQIYNPKTFGRRIQEAQLALNAFWASGIVVADPLIQAQIGQGGNVGEITHFGPLATNEPNYSSDDPAVFSTPQNISTKIQRFRLAARNQSWSTMDLARELALQDPADAIINRIGAYWATDDEKRLIQTCLGIKADNVANDNSDMVKDVSTDAATAVDPDTELIGGVQVIQTLQTMGDRSFSISAIAMHSVPFAKLQTDKLIDYEQVEGQDLRIPRYLGKRVIVDDDLPAIAGTNRIRYTSILFGGACFGTGQGKVENPSEMDRIPDSGNGAGQDVIYSRVSNLIHPYGFDFTSTTLNGGIMANYADLALAANWDRKVARKLIPLAFLVTNG